jgi:hypothetical protein
VSSKSRAIIETAKQEIEAATDAWRDLDAQQAELLMTVNAQLLESVSNRRLLTDKQAGLDAAIADEDYDLAAAIEDQMADLKLSLQVEASADRVELRAALLGLLTAKQDVWGKESEIHAQTVELLQDSMHAQEEEVRAPSSLRPMLCRVLACPIWSAGVQRTGCGTIVHCVELRCIMPTKVVVILVMGGAVLATWTTDLRTWFPLHCRSERSSSSLKRQRPTKRPSSQRSSPSSTGRRGT